MRREKADRRTMTGYALTCALLLFLFLLSVMMGENTRNLWLKEGGVIESATVIGYVLCAALIIYRHKTAHLKHFLLLIIFFMLKELDFDKRFTTMSLFKIKFFLSQKVPLIEKAYGATVVLLLIYICISIVYRHSKPFLAGLKKRSAVSCGAMLTLTLLALSLLLDGLGRNLKGFGVAVSGQMSIYLEAFEELAEFGIPVVILLTLQSYFKGIEG